MSLGGVTALLQETQLSLSPAKLPSSLRMRGTGVLAPCGQGARAGVIAKFPISTETQGRGCTGVAGSGVQVVAHHLVIWLPKLAQPSAGPWVSASTKTQADGGGVRRSRKMGLGCVS